MTTLKSTSRPLRQLTFDEKARYEQQGFVLIQDVFPKETLMALDAEISRLRAEKNPNGHMSRNFILRLGLRSPLMERMVRDERILALVESVVQPGLAIYSAKLVEKLPFDDTVCHWHQDDAYYQRNSQSASRMSIWLPLQDTTEEMGSLWVVPGSHKAGLKENSHRIDGVCNLCFEDGKTLLEGAIPVPIKAGSVLLFHALTWHRSLGNRTARMRRSFIVSYQDALASRGNLDQHQILRPA